MHDGTSFCPDLVTRCPTRTTCCENLLSLTGYGCCMEPDAVRCPDSWHCCSRGGHCSPDCNFRSCKCLFPSTRPVVSNLQNDENKKEEKESKEGFKSHFGSHSEDVKPVTPDKPVKPVKPVNSVKPVKQVKDQKVVPKAGRKNKNVKPTEKRGRKNGHKTGMKTKQKSIKKLSGTKTQNKHREEWKDKHHQHKKKNKKHRTKKGKKMDQKLRNKAKAIETMNKHVVKAHTTHRKTNYHPTVKQHRVSTFDDGFGITKKHKPDITFDHTWGKRKHQHLSYKQNGKKKKKFGKDTSLTEELKHLIVKHRRKKLRTKLKLHMHRRPMYGSYKNGINYRLEPRKMKEKEKSIHSAESHKFVKHLKSRKKKVLASKKINEVNMFNKHKDNPINLEHENLATANEFNNLRQTSQEKAVANKNSYYGNQRSNPPKKNKKIVEHFTETDSPQNVDSTNISTEKPTNELDRKTSDSTLKNESIVQSTTHLHRTILTKISNMNGKDKNISTNLVEKYSSSGLGFPKHVPSAKDIVSQKVVHNTKHLSPVTGDPSFHLKPSLSAHSELNKSNVHQNNNRLHHSGKGDTEITTKDEALAKHGIRNFNASNAGIDGVIFTSSNNARTDGVASGSSFKGTGSASGSMESLSLTTSSDESIKGESEAIEQIDSNTTGTDRAVSSSGFDAEDTSTISALTSDSDDSIKGEPEAIEQMDNDTTGTDRVVSSSGLDAEDTSTISALTSDSDDSIKGEPDTIEQMDNNTTGTDRVVSSSGFDAEDTSTISALTSDSDDSIKGEPDAIEQMDNNTTGTDPVVSSSGFDAEDTSTISSLTSDSDDSIKGEPEAMEQMDNNTGTDSAVSSSGFEAEDTPTVSASGFLVSSARRDNYRDSHIDEDVTKQTDGVVSSTGLKFKEFSFGSANGLKEQQEISDDHRDLNNGNDVRKYMDKNTRTDRVAGESGLEANREFAFISGNGLQAQSSLSDGYRDSDNGYGDSYDVAKHMNKNAATEIVLSGSEFEADESSIGSAGGHLSNDYSSSDHLIKKLLLGNEDDESFTNHLEEFETTKGLPSKGSSTNVSVGNVLYMPSISPNAIKASDDGMANSGSKIDDVSGDVGSGLHFGGEGDIDDESDAEENNFRSSSRDDVHSRLLPSSGKSSYNFTSKEEGNTQNILHHYSGRFSQGSSTNISQMRYSDWDDVEDSNSGFKSSTQWGSGEFDSSESLSGQSPTTEYTPDSVNVENTFYPNRSFIEGERARNNINMNLERRSIVRGSMTGNHISYKKRGTENNHLMSWKDKELQQLLHWLSTKDENNLKQKTPKSGNRNYKTNKQSLQKIPQTSSNSTTMYSQIQDVLLKKIFPNFSKS